MLIHLSTPHLFQPSSSCPPLASMVRDDLARCLLMISGKREFPPSVLQCVLAIFGTLITSVGPSMRIMVECFLIHVYMKGLKQFFEMLTAKVFGLYFRFYFLNVCF